MSFAIRPLQHEDRSGWERLARGYKEFYRTPTTEAEFESAWRRLLSGGTVHGLVAIEDNDVVGIAHYLFHPVVWGAPACYLQDSFTSERVRAQGVGSALIGAVAQEARRGGASRYHWLTHVDNLTARSLYDKVGQHRGFIRYECPLEAA